MKKIALLPDGCTTRHSINVFGACKETLKSLVAPLQVKANSAGDEKARHAGWLEQQMSDVALTKEQTAEIKHAIIKGRPHKVALEQFQQKQMPQNPLNVQGTLGSGAASSSGKRFPPTPRRSPSRNPPMRNPPLPNAPRGQSLRTPPGGPQVARGSAKRVRSGSRRSDDPLPLRSRRFEMNQLRPPLHTDATLMLMSD